MNEKFHQRIFFDRYWHIRKVLLLEKHVFRINFMLILQIIVCLFVLTALISKIRLVLNFDCVSVFGASKINFCKFKKKTIEKKYTY